MRVYVGTSGFAYKPWKGRFYPANLADAKMLSFYASRFSACEINNTYYRFPDARVLASWAKEVPRGFVFALKAPKAIVSGARRWNAPAMVRVVETAEALGDARGPFFVRLPDGLAKDARRLGEFLDGVAGAKARFVFDFRDPSWFDDETFALLRAHDAALVWNESEEIVAPRTPTARFGYVRLRSSRYTTEELAAWAARIVAEDWTDAFVFFRHEDEGRGPEYGAELVGLLGEAART